MASDFESFVAVELLKAQTSIISEYRQHTASASTAWTSRDQTQAQEGLTLRCSSKDFPASRLSQVSEIALDSVLPLEEITQEHESIPLKLDSPKAKSDAPVDGPRSCEKWAEARTDSLSVTQAEAAASVTPDYSSESSLPSPGSPEKKSSVKKASFKIGTTQEFEFVVLPNATDKDEDLDRSTSGKLSNSDSNLDRSLSRRTSTASTKSGNGRSAKGRGREETLLPHDIFTDHEDTFDESCELKLHTYTTRSEVVRPHFMPGRTSTLHNLSVSMRADRGKCRPAAIDPSNPKRICWDAMGILLICYDLVFIPLTIFNLPASTFFSTMQWLSLCFWALDIPASFFVGIHVQGTLQMNLGVIARHYLRTFFAMDVSLVSIDICVIAIAFLTAGDTGGDATDPSGVARVAKSWRMLRILRGLRLIRLIKLPQNLASIMQHIHSERVVVIIGIAKLTGGVLVLNHVIACLWYGFCWYGDSPQSWFQPHKIADSSTAFLYMTALHWSLTQFTPASMEVNPVSLHERIFAVVVIVFALVTFSSFVSSITNAMEHLRNLNSEHTKNFSQLQRFFRNNNISMSLSSRVTRYVDYKRILAKRILSEKDVVYLQLLSQALRINVHYELNSPLFKLHPFFAAFDKQDLRCMKLICYGGVESHHASEGDILFSQGERTKQFFLVQSGALQYSHRYHGHTIVKEGSWISEPVLWTSWTHMGTAHAFSESVIDALDHKKFLDFLGESAVDLSHPAHYAHLFLEHLKSLNREDLTDVNDPRFPMELNVHVAFTEIPEKDDRPRPSIRSSRSLGSIFTSMTPREITP